MRCLMRARFDSGSPIKRRDGGGYLRWLEKWPRPMLIIAFFIVYGSAILDSHSSFAQPTGFTCPRNGTIAQYEFGKVQYLGPTRDDRYNCAFIGVTGKKGSLLFNFYWAEGDDYKAVRKAMLSLLLNETQSVRFTFLYPGNRNQYQETWAFRRMETLVLDGRKIDAAVYERHQEGMLGNDHHGRWMLWLDPRTGIWVKREFSLLRGQAMGVSQTAGALLSITDP